MFMTGPSICLVYRYSLPPAEPDMSCMANIGQQALAAVGQCRLMSLWDSLFGHLRLPVAQILLTRNDIADVCL